MNDRERITLRLPTELYEEIKRVADEKGISVNAMITNILWDFYGRKEKKQ